MHEWIDGWLDGWMVLRQFEVLLGVRENGLLATANSFFMVTVPTTKMNGLKHKCIDERMNGCIPVLRQFEDMLGLHGNGLLVDGKLVLHGYCFNKCFSFYKPKVYNHTKAQILVWQS